jgi:hypothetical protein
VLLQGQTVHVHERCLGTAHVHVHSVHVQTRKLCFHGTPTATRECSWLRQNPPPPAAWAATHHMQNMRERNFWWDV